jgi:hypothetical protein
VPGGRIASAGGPFEGHAVELRIPQQVCHDSCTFELCRAGRMSWCGGKERIGSHGDLEIEWETNTKLGGRSADLDSAESFCYWKHTSGFCFNKERQRTAWCQLRRPVPVRAKHGLRPRTRSPSIKLSSASCCRQRSLCRFCLLLSPMVVSATARSLRHKGTGQYRQIRTYDRLHCGSRVW